MVWTCFNSFQATLADMAQDPVFHLAALVVLLLWALPSLQSQKFEGPTLLAPSDHIFCYRQLSRIASMAGCIVLTGFQTRQQMVCATNVAGTWYHGFSGCHNLFPDIRSLQVPLSPSNDLGTYQDLGRETPG